MQQLSNQNNRNSISTIEWQVICKILQDGNLEFISNYNITEDYFDQFKEEFRYIKNHFEIYNNTPDNVTFYQKFQERFANLGLDIIEVNENEKFLFDKLNEEYNYRKVIPKLNKFSQILSTDSREAIRYLQAEFGEWNSQEVSTGVDLFSKEALNERKQIYEDTKINKGKHLITTGLTELDEIIGGFRRGGELVIVSAKSGFGKTFLLLKMIHTIWKSGLNVMIVEPEMLLKDLGYRLDSFEGHISNFKLSTGGDIGIEFQQYIDSIQEHTNKFMATSPKDFKNNVTVSKLKNYCKQNNIDVLAIDGVVCMSDERKSKGDQRWTELTHISEDLMQLSNDLKIPVLLVQQLNRTGDRNSNSTDQDEVGGSAGLVHNASLVLAIKRKDNVSTIEIVKSRWGGTNRKLMYVVDYDTGTYVATDFQNEKEVVKRESIKNTRKNDYESAF